MAPRYDLARQNVTPKTCLLIGDKVMKTLNIDNLVKSVMMVILFAVSIGPFGKVGISLYE
jgi:hypothetical protein